MLQDSDLGKKSEYRAQYDPSLLFPIPRVSKRQEIGIGSDLPFVGYDLWNHYEVSWLNEQGKPLVGMAVIHYPCESKCIIESKSMKLYFNSFNNSSFSSRESLEALAINDLSERVGCKVFVHITDLKHAHNGQYYAKMEGVCLDDLNVSCSKYTVFPEYLTTGSKKVHEVLCSNLLKSNCLVTHQPDWGSVQIHYSGQQINHEGLLKYLVSFRNHNEFHEQCIERIFVDILKRCQPEALSVYGRYTRRGGLDINVYRGTMNRDPLADNSRLIRQ